MSVSDILIYLESMRQDLQNRVIVTGDFNTDETIRRHLNAEYQFIIMKLKEIYNG